MIFLNVKYLNIPHGFLETEHEEWENREDSNEIQSASNVVSCMKIVNYFGERGVALI